MAKYVLTGKNYGKTLKINPHAANPITFNNGVFEYPGRLENLQDLTRLLASYNAYPVPSEAYRDALIRDKELGIGQYGTGNSEKAVGGTVLGGTGANGAGTTGESNGQGDGAANSVPARQPVDAEGSAAPTGGLASLSPDTAKNAAVIKAIRGLDPADDSHWTDEGLPMISKIEESGFPGLTRQEVTEALPGWNRDLALKEVGL